MIHCGKRSDLMRSTLRQSILEAVIKYLGWRNLCAAPCTFCRNQRSVRWGTWIKQHLASPFSPIFVRVCFSIMVINDYCSQCILFGITGRNVGIIQEILSVIGIFVFPTIEFIPIMDWRFRKICFIQCSADSVLLSTNGWAVNAVYKRNLKLQLVSVRDANTVMRINFKSGTVCISTEFNFILFHIYSIQRKTDMPLSSCSWLKYSINAIVLIVKIARNYTFDAITWRNRQYRSCFTGLFI